MKYFNGFCLSAESELFEQFIDKSDFCVVGFSYGAQRAFEYALTCRDRIDKLQLISPAFFEDKSDKFKKLQTIYFKKNSDEYCKNFISNVSQINIDKYFQKGNEKELKELLYYSWSEENLKKLTQKGIEIEVYLGENDKIIDSLHVKNFFQEFATIYYIKNVGHILK